jgi:hypothetical protein
MYRSSPLALSPGMRGWAVEVSVRNLVLENVARTPVQDIQLPWLSPREGDRALRYMQIIAIRWMYVRIAPSPESRHILVPIQGRANSQDI